ncbi:MAG: class I SAM-dependent methyltransferase [Planctomycetota bacterium]
MLPRTLEPEVMDDSDEVALYGEMDHRAVNEGFVDDLLAGGQVGPRVLDLGCGTAAIPVILCQRDSDLEVLGIDASIEMLEAARIEIELGGMQGRVFLEHADCKQLSGFQRASCDTLISNSLVHHLADPLDALRDAIGIVKPGGRLFIRDLLRPSTDQDVETLVSRHAATEPELAQQLLRQSLHAALNEAELGDLVEQLGLSRAALRVTSDRHWTLDARIER